ncbi:MAG: hypothetical protein SCAL_000070 [Candidatus Syntrophoarchaeum caldarius]|uniref:Uncharacterized protein n=1 Tax=Candidatus Syntropharchaeum caldarium TaxID=1838285 RepID=A0A1F2PBI4_9EURY|nr:MAG: hypothetical protein SCAL_000070 [Candidatus Syntrophoarchaeum caldarius]
MVAEQDPGKQGLKLELDEIVIRNAGGCRARSRKTRIETSTAGSTPALLIGLQSKIQENKD